MKYLVTGHTGFKGSWLTMLLLEQGHDVAGLALNPIEGALFTVAGLNSMLSADIRLDIRDANGVQEALQMIHPDVLIHMAAQPLVRASYLDPRGTVETNVIGTMNVMEAARRCDSVAAQVIVTTDKVYRNVGQVDGYVESDPLGGHDPYSASKAATDIITQSWTSSLDGPPTAIVRAGNVIGGGDVSPDRLLPDLIRGFVEGVPTEIRYPKAVRPWQHVLDCLNGYLDVTNALLQGQGLGEWNFGPGAQGFVPVSEVADIAVEAWNAAVPGSNAAWVHKMDEHPHEATLLALDASKAEGSLGWRNRLDVKAAIDWTIAWEAEVAQGAPPLEVTHAQIHKFLSETDLP